MPSDSDRIKALIDCMMELRGSTVVSISTAQQAQKMLEMLVKDLAEAKKRESGQLDRAAGD